MTVRNSQISCGVYQLFNLNDGPADNLASLVGAYKAVAQRNGRKNGFAQVIFSDNTDFQNGERLADYLTAQFPTSTPISLIAKRSPSTGNTIQTWIWNIPHPSFKKHPVYLRTRRNLRYNDWN